MFSFESCYKIGHIFKQISRLGTLNFSTQLIVVGINGVIIYKLRLDLDSLIR